jgi:hypothetical protein
MNIATVVCDHELGLLSDELVKSRASRVCLSTPPMNKKGQVSRLNIVPDKVQPLVRAAQQNVFARLQALFPNAPSSPTLQDRAASYPVVPAAKVLKVRIVTWNMHDSVPKVCAQRVLRTKRLTNHQGRPDGTAWICSPPCTL